jgi:Rieske Fe-S protein
VTADRVVVATHYPFLDRALAFPRVHPQRSYALVCSIAGDPPPGMYISGDGPTRSVRAVPLGGEEKLLVGGEGHRTGEGGDTEQRYRALEAFAREHWDVRSIDYRWSSQDNTTVDTVPYVGRLQPFGDRLLMATGFAKWGMTGGTAAARILADELLGRENPWASLFDPNRFKPRAAAARFVEENAKVGLHMVGDRFRHRGTRPIEALAPGEGDIVRLHGQKVAGHRRDDGTLVAVSPVCTHLGCQVNWNTAERSWDCPCHGSRFSPDGDVLQGPAVHRLEHKPL